MPHRPSVLLFLGLFLFLNPIVVSSALTGRDELGGDSLWGLDLDDVFGAGAAGIGALSTFLDFGTAPGTTATPSGAPSEQQDEMPGSRDPEGVPLSESTAMDKCAAEEENVEQSWWQVEQEPETGYVAPKVKYYGDDCQLQSRGMARRKIYIYIYNTDLGLYAGGL